MNQDYNCVGQLVCRVQLTKGNSKVMAEARRILPLLAVAAGAGKPSLGWHITFRMWMVIQYHLFEFDICIHIHIYISVAAVLREGRISHSGLYLLFNSKLYRYGDFLIRLYHINYEVLACKVFFVLSYRETIRLTRQMTE